MGRAEWSLPCSGSGQEPRDRAPGGEAGLQQLVVRGGREEVATGAEVVGDRAKGSEKLLGVLRRFAPLERPFTSASRPVGVFCPIVHAFVSSVLRLGEHAPHGRRLAG